MANFFDRLRNGLQKTRTNLVGGITDALSGSGKFDEATLETLEERLIAADLGVDTTLEVIENLRRTLGRAEANDREAILSYLKDELTGRLRISQNGQTGTPAEMPSPCIIMVVGVNGVGKTTTIGKLAYRFREQGKKTIIGAADTFRAAASQQLEIWAKRAGAHVVRNRAGADPASVAFDTVTAALSRGADVAILDTAGRLHTRANLMEELKKIQRVVANKLPGAPHENLLVLDATVGQNGLRQASEFHEAIGVTGLVVTKLDGTAKGGIVFAISEKLRTPIKYIGVGEGIDDLQPFDPGAYVEAMFS